MIKYFNFLRKVCTAFSVLLFVILAKPAFAVYETNTVELDNEYWISTNTDSDNLGTLDNPFICNTQPAFDLTMNSLPANSTIHILAGTYQTLGSDGWYVKSGQKILGSGIDVTIIQLVPHAPSGDTVIASHLGTNMVVSDLTADGNYISGVYSYFGVELSGTKLTVSGVKAINLAFFDTSAGTEAWGIGCNSFGYGSTLQSEGNLIEDCEVSQFQGGSAITAIFFDGSPSNSISGIMRDNRVYLPSVPFSYLAFNGTYAHDWLVEGNYVHGGGTAFYGDTGSYSNVVVAHNFFENCYDGVDLMNGNRNNLTFAFNTILLNAGANQYYHNDAFFFYTASGFTYTNIVITGNIVNVAGSPVVGMTYNFLNADTVGGLTVANNTVNSLMSDQFSSCNAVNLYNNFDLNGKILNNINQVEPPNGTTRTSVTTLFYSAQYSDKYIGMKATNNFVKTVYLPSAVGHAGKEFIVADESGQAVTYPINILSASPDTINGTTSVGLRIAYGAKTVISDGTNWFAH